MKKYLGVLLACLMAVPAFADTITLKTGKKVEGKIIERNDEFIRIDVGDGIELTYYLDEIEEPAGKASGAGSGAAPAAAPERDTVPEQPYTPPPAIPAPEGKALSAQDPEWGVFQKYRSAMKTHDFKKINEVAFKDFGEAGDEFGPFFDFVYGQIRNLKAEDFTFLFKDDKQSILVSAAKPQGLPVRGYARDTMFLGRDSAGALKLITVGHEGWSVPSGSSDENAAEDLKAEMLDSDGDGLTNRKEECTRAGQFGASCTPTDPGVKDSDGDGWLDGTEVEAGTDPQDNTSHPF